MSVSETSWQQKWKKEHRTPLLPQACVSCWSSSPLILRSWRDEGDEVKEDSWPCLPLAMWQRWVSMYRGGMQQSSNSQGETHKVVAHVLAAESMTWWEALDGLTVARGTSGGSLLAGRRTSSANRSRLKSSLYLDDRRPDVVWKLVEDGFCFSQDHKLWSISGWWRTWSKFRRWKWDEQQLTAYWWSFWRWTWQTGCNEWQSTS